MQNLPQDKPNAVIDMLDSTKRMCRIDDAALIVGAHLVTQRSGYTHHGIYVGNRKVVHYAGLSRSLRRGPVQETSLVEFAGGHDIWIKQTPHSRYSGEEVVRRAYFRLGEDHYRLTTNNCEHFCSWCLEGQSHSDQIDFLLALPHRWLRSVLDAMTQLVRAKPEVASAGRLPC